LAEGVVTEMWKIILVDEQMENAHMPHMFSWRDKPNLVGGDWNHGILFFHILGIVTPTD
jgi:hypothetical protein